MSQTPHNPMFNQNIEHLTLGDEALGMVPVSAELQFSAKKSQDRGHTGTAHEWKFQVNHDVPRPAEAFASISRSDAKDSATSPLLGIQSKNAESKLQRNSGLVASLNESKSKLLQPMSDVSSVTLNHPSPYPGAANDLPETFLSSSHTSTIEWTDSSASSVKLASPTTHSVGKTPYPVDESLRIAKEPPYPASGLLHPSIPAITTPIQTHPPMEQILDSPSTPPIITATPPEKHENKRIESVKPSVKPEQHLKHIFFVCCMLVFVVVLVTVPFIVAVLTN